MKSKKRSHSICPVLITVLVLITSLPALAQANKSAGNDTSLLRLSRSLEELAQRVGPSVVQVFATSFSPIEGGELLSATSLSKQHTVGSGVVLDAAGYIVTNAHVVERARLVEVLLATPMADGGPARSILKPKGRRIRASIVGRDEETDLAVLKINRQDLSALPLADSDLLRPGQIVIAFGSPLGLRNSASLGVISATARQLHSDDPMIYIQTDASINPGSSGGPLLNAAGEVVGINTLIFSQSGGSEGIGFAAPSNIVRHVFDEIRGKGRVRRGQLGIQVQTITPALADGLGLAQEWGVIVSDVPPESLATLSDLKIGDVVLTLNGKVMENARQFEVNIYRSPLGELVYMELLRGSEKHTARVPVTERQDQQDRFLDLKTPEHNLIPQLGIFAVDLTDEVRRMLPFLRKNAGVVVAAMVQDGPAWGERFLPGDVIYSVNNQPVANLAALRVIARELEAGSAVAFQVQRQTGLIFVTLEIRGIA